MPILTKFSEPKWTLEPSELESLKTSAKLLLHCASKIKNCNKQKVYMQIYRQLNIIHNIPGPLLSADQVRYTTYKLTIDDCSKPDFSCTRWTQEVIEIELITKHITIVNMIKNLFKVHPLS